MNTKSLRRWLRAVLLPPIVLFLAVPEAAADFLGDSWCLEDTVNFYAQFNDQGGSAVTATAATWRVYEQGSGTALDNGSLTAVDAGSALGLFDGSVDLDFADGYEVGKAYIIRVTGTADTKTPAATHYFRITCGTTVAEAGTAQAGAAGTITLRSGASATDDLYNGQTVQISSGTGAGQSRVISDYVGSSKVATVGRNWSTNPDSSSVYRLRLTDAPKTDSSMQVTTGTLAAGVVTTAAFASGAIDASAIAADAIGASEIATSAIGALEVADSTIDAATFASGAIDASAIAADAIGASEIATGAIGALEVADSTIDAATFASGAIDNAAIATDAISAAKIANGSIGATEIADSSIDAATFATGAITADAIASDAITSAEVAADAIGAVEIANAAIDAATFATGALTADAIATDAITATEIAADAIGASELATDAVGASELAQAAADKSWATAARTLTAATNVTSTGSTLWLDGSGKVDLSGPGVNAIFNQSLLSYSTVNTCGWKLKVLQP